MDGYEWHWVRVCEDLGYLIELDWFVLSDSEYHDEEQ